MRDDVRFCPYCGERMLSTASYCAKCGAQLPVQESQPTGQQQY
ncbi:MAG: zinc-ribbon domain-containing protein [Methanomassiliicoccales archaeon]|nr:zinc-ribbon domain-containing protein [Methanomassiliicoccales archaeon]